MVKIKSFSTIEVITSMIIISITFYLVVSIYNQIIQQEHNFNQVVFQTEACRLMDSISSTKDIKNINGSNHLYYYKLEIQPSENISHLLCVKLEFINKINKKKIYEEYFFINDEYQYQ